MTAIHEAPPAAATPPAPPTRAERRVLRKADRRRRFLRDRSLVLMTLPAIALVLVFNYAPMFGTVTAFQSYSIYAGFWHSPWTGLTTFQRLFNDPYFWHALENTLTLSLVQLVLFFPVPILLALLLNTVLSTKIRTFVQSVVYLPHFFSWVLAITIFQQMLGGAGALNQFLRAHDMSTWNIMTNPDTFKLLVTAQVVWKEAGWGIIVFLAALAAIDTQLYEAAAADGAGRWRRMWHITLPGIRSIVVLMLVLQLGNVLTIGFEQMLIQRFAVGRDASEVLDTYAYFYGVVNANFSLGAAASLFKGVLSLILILTANKVAHLFGEDGLYRR
ncbi:ABC transporter permease [Paractinoplanes durhamensis]|uniref:Polysaccharide ABC transporter ATP-binding protein n=1 Tax=Paractinoplanes durhamensis TaxID=113563 RepID=A0ABQ3YVB2_9ACTN|nr:ABC transporter permease subunit [Actinoplanes durhamensis]GIE01480.1 polysaccharide ABC transporter ATP-binding protein [Actinoplanes durhamensis]